MDEVTSSPQLILVFGCGTCSNTVPHFSNEESRAWFKSMGITPDSPHEIRFINGGAGALFHDHSGMPDENSGMKFLYHEIVSRPNIDRIVFANHLLCEWYLSKMGVLGFINGERTIENKIRGDLHRARDLTQRVLHEIHMDRSNMASKFLLLRGKQKPDPVIKTFLQEGTSLSEVKRS